MEGRSFTLTDASYHGKGGSRTPEDLSDLPTVRQQKYLAKFLIISAAYSIVQLSV